LAESNRFYTDLTFYFTYDSEVTKNNIKVQYRVEGAQSWSPEIPNEDEIVLGSTTTSPYLKIKLPATLSSDKKYEF
jgi:long-subunit fatty acid transport protein